MKVKDVISPATERTVATKTSTAPQNAGPAKPIKPPEKYQHRNEDEIEPKDKPPRSSYKPVKPKPSEKPV